MLSGLDEDAPATSWRDDTQKRIFLALVLGGAAVLLPLLGVVALYGNFGPYGNRVADFLNYLVWWPMPLLWSLLPGSRGESEFGCVPPDSFLLSPILSIVIYSAAAYAVLSFVARRTRLS